MDVIERIMGVPRDERIKDWVYLSSPKYLIMVLSVYLGGICWLGQKLMENRKPFKLRKVILAYNATQMLLNVYFAWKIWYLAFHVKKHNLLCQPLNHGTDKDSLEMLDTFFWYMMVRIADFLDTLFFVLTKKFDHVSTLHMSHHALVVYGAWLWFQYAADGHGIAGIILNACIHVIMYGYYFLAALGPHMKPYLWWKKYLTSLQLTQFALVIIHTLLPVFFPCGYPTRLIWLGIPQGLPIVYMFIKFYIQSYTSNHQKPASHMANGNTNGTIAYSKPVPRPQFKTHCFADDSVPDENENCNKID